MQADDETVSTQFASAGVVVVVRVEDVLHRRLQRDVYALETNAHIALTPHIALAEFRIAASGDPRLALELQLVIVQAQVAGLEVELVPRAVAKPSPLSSRAPGL